MTQTQSSRQDTDRSPTRRPSFQPRRIASILLLATLALAATAAADHQLRPLSAGFVPDGEIEPGSYWTSPDSEWTAFSACDVAINSCRLASAHRNAPAGAPFVDLAGPYLTGIVRLRITPDSRRAIFLAWTDIGIGSELWSVPLDGGAAPVRLHPALGGSAFVIDFELSVDGALAVLTTSDGLGNGSLLRSPVDGSSPATPLDDGDLEKLFVFATPGGAQYALYFIDTDANGRLEIRKVALAGGSPLPLGPVDLRAGVSLDEVRVVADASRALILGDLSTAGQTELFSLELGGPAPLTALNPALNGNGNVEGFELADGGRAVLLADAQIDGKFELWSVEVDAATPPVKLSGSLAADRDVLSSFAVAGSWVVYLADATVDEKYELWSAPIDGGASPTRRSDTVPAGRDVSRFRIAPNGTRLIYGGDLEVLGRTDLYRSTVFGLIAHERLTNLAGGYPAPYNVREFQISPDSAAVAFDIWPEGGWNGVLFEQTLLAPQPLHEILAVSSGLPLLIDFVRYLPDSAGLTFMSRLTPGERRELHLTDERCFADGFESGDRTAWSASLP